MNFCLLLSRILGSRKEPVVVPTYTVSGTILDSATNGISGVTVALSGDASDSTTTNASGEYSFSGVEDGSYTVTPTLSGFTFSPTSRDISVSGDNVVVDAISDDGKVVLPFILNVSDFSAGALATADGWRDMRGGGKPTIIASSLTDANSYTPTGVSNVAHFDESVLGTGYHDCGWKFPYSKVFDTSLNAFRMAALVYSPDLDTIYPGLSLESITDDGSNDDFCASTYSETQSPDICAFGDLVAGSANNSAQTNCAGGDQVVSRWVWVRFEWNETSPSYFSMYRVEDGSLLHTQTTVGFNSFNIRAYKYIYQRAYIDATESDVYIAGWWVGKKTDDWPTNTLSATSLLWP